MAERVTDLRDIERRVVAHLVGEPEPGVPLPDEPSVLVAEDLAPADTAGLDPRSCSPWSPSAAARPATPRSSPASSASPAWSAPPAPSRSPPAPACWSTAPPGRSRSTPTPTRPTRGSPPTSEERAALADLGRPGRAPPTARRSSCSPTSPTASRRARRSAAAGRGGRACSAPSCASSTARTSRPSRSRPTSTREVLERLRPATGAVRRGPHPRRRLRQADRLRDPRGRGEPRPRRPRPAALLRQPRPARPPARRDRARPPSAPAPRPG